MKETRPHVPRQLKTSIPLYVISGLITVILLILTWKGILPLYAAIILYIIMDIVFIYIFSRSWESEMLHPHFEKYFPVMRSVLPLDSTDLLFLSAQRNPVSIQQFVMESDICCLIAFQYFIKETKFSNSHLLTNYRNQLQTSFEQILRPELEKLGKSLFFTIQDTQYALLNLDLKLINLPFLEDNSPSDTICAALNENICRKIAPLHSEFEKSNDVEILCVLGSINVEDHDFTWVSTSTQDMLLYAHMSGATSGLYSFYQFQHLFSQEEKNRRVNLAMSYS